MSSGGPFILSINTTEEDELIFKQKSLLRVIANLNAVKVKKIFELNPDISVSKLLKVSYENLPTFSEIEQINFFNTVYKPIIAMTSVYSKTTPIQGQKKLGTTTVFTLPIYGEFIADAAIHCTLTGLSAVSALDRVKYVDFLGHKMIKKISLKLNNKTVSSYSSDKYNIFYDCKLKNDLQSGYNKLVGQENPVIAQLNPDIDLEYVQFIPLGLGAQTFKQTQDTVEMMIPLLFWFNNLKTPLPNYMLTQGTTQIEVEFESSDLLISVYNGGGGGGYNLPVMSTCDLYLNHLYVDTVVMDMFKKYFKFQLIRTDQWFIEEIKNNSGSLYLQKFRGLIECLYIGFRPKSNYLVGKKWYKNLYLTTSSVNIPVVDEVLTIGYNQANYYNEYSMIKNVGITLNGNVINTYMPGIHYSTYVPFIRGVKTPKEGWLSFCYNQNQDVYQPSGHLSTLTIREMYLNYEGNVVSGVDVIRSDNPANVIGYAECLNFLIVDDKGGAILKYT